MPKSTATPAMPTGKRTAGRGGHGCKRNRRNFVMIFFSI
jgi:hypothetical protein